MDLRHSDFTELTDYVARAGEAVGEHAIVVRGNGVAAPIQLHYPLGWSETDVPGEHETFQIVVIEKNLFPFALSNGTHEEAVPLLDRWPEAAKVGLGPYSIWSCSAIVQAAVPEWTTNTPRLAIWYPPFDLVAVSPEPALAALNQAGLSFHGIEERYQAKLEVFSRLKCVWIDAREFRLGSERETTLETVAARICSIQQRLGGRLVFLAALAGLAD